MKALFKVVYTYQSYSTSYYDGSKIKKEREMFLNYSTDENGIKNPDYVPTNRLSGFERASIDIIETVYIRDINPVEVIDFDIERNELSAVVMIDDLLENTLNHDEAFENNINLIAGENYEGDVHEALISLGYKERCTDNTYNYSSDLENELNYHVYTLDENSDWIYDESAVIVIDEHIGLDVRAGYTTKGIYKSNDYEGLCYFLMGFHIGVSIIDADWNEIESYDGDYAIGNALNDYTLVSLNENNEIKVKDNDGDMFTLSFNSPAFGV